MAVSLPSTAIAASLRDYVPLVVSLVSVVIAAIALGWNIYRDVFSKARVKMWASRIVIRQGQEPAVGPFFDITVTNMGPGSIKIEMIVFRNPRRWLKPFDRWGGVILYDWKNPFSSKLPTRIEPGDKITLLLPWSDQDERCAFLHPFGRIGVSDSFGRNHWVPSKRIGYLREKFATEFRRAKIG